MEKKFIKLFTLMAVLLTVTAMLFSMAACSSDGEGGDASGVVYTLSSDETYYIVTGFSGDATEVSIKNTYEGKPVKEIGPGAFSSNILITSVSFRSNNTIIGEEAFIGCTSLKTVELSKNLSEIKSRAFYGCISLEQLSLPDSVTTIGSNAFYGCTSLVLSCPYYSTDKPSGWASDWNGDIIPSWKIREHAFEFVTSYTDAQQKTISGSALVKNAAPTLYSEPISVPMAGYAFMGWYDNEEFSGSPIVFPYSNTEKYKLYAKYSPLSFFTYRYSEDLTVEIINSLSISAFEKEIGFYMLESKTDVSAVINESEDFKPKAINIPSMYGDTPVIGIDDNTFKDVKSLVSVTFESDSNLRFVGDFAFYGTSISTYKVNNTLRYLGAQALSNISTLNEITVFQDNEYFSVDVALYDIDKTTLYQYPAGRADKQYVLPNTVKRINDGGFLGARIEYLDVSLAVNLASLGAYSFCDSALLTVGLPSTIKTIGERAFKNGVFSTFSFSASAVNTSIPAGMLENCTNLKSITLPSTIRSIGENAFMNCSSLTEVIQEDSELEILGGYAFWGCTHLTSYAIPTELTAIGFGAFGNCPKLELAISPVNTGYIIEGGILYDAGKTELLYYPISSEAATITLPESLEYIRDYAFYGSKIKDIAIPERVIELCKGAFGSCAELEACTFWETGSLAAIGEDCFANSEALLSMVIPNTVTAIGKNAFTTQKGIMKFTGKSKEDKPETWEGDWENDKLVFWNVSKRAYSFITANGSDVADITDYIVSTMPVSVPDTTGSFTGWYDNELCEGEPVSFPYYRSGETGTTLYAGYERLRVTKNNKNQFTISGYYSNPIAIYIGDTFTETIKVEGEDTTVTGDVIGIADNAFSSCGSLVSVVFSSTCKVADIGENAFSSTSLTSLSLPAGVKNVGVNAFINNTELSELTFAEGSLLTEIAMDAFANTLIASVVFPNSLTKLSGFQNTKFTEITIPLNVTNIGDNAFKGCGELVTVRFVENAKLLSIGADAFAATKISSIDFPEKLESVNGFKDTKLTSVFISDSILSIEDEAFYNCVELNSVSFSAECELDYIGVNAFYGSAISSIALTKDISTILTNAFNGCDKLTIYCEMSAEDKPEKWETNWAANRPIVWNRTTTVFSFNDPKLETIKDFLLDTMPISIPEDGGFVGWVTNANLTGSTITFPYSTSLSEQTLYAKYTSLIYEEIRNESNVLIGYSVKGYNRAEGAPVVISIPRLHSGFPVLAIADYAFSSNGTINSVYFAEDSELTKIGDYAFSGTRLSEITLPASVSAFGNGVFSYCEHLKSINVEASNSYFKAVDGVLYDKLGERLIAYPYGLSDIVFLMDVKEIADYAFYGMKMKEVSLPDSIVSLGDYAFYGCASLQTLLFGSNSDLSYIGKNCFENCAIKSLTLPVSLTEIDDGAFKNIELLNTISFKTGSLLRKIGEEAFSNSAVTSISFPLLLEKIGNNAFENCTLLKTIVFPEGIALCSIGSSAFHNTALSSLSLPAKLKFIGDKAFCDCEELIAVTFPGSSELLFVGNYAFSGAAIEKIIIPINSSENEMGEVGELLEELTESTFDEELTVSDYSIIGDYAFYNCELLSSVTLGIAVTGIGKNAFSGAILRTITIPDSVKTIKEGAFNNYATLESVNFIGDGSGSGLTTLGKDAFLSSRLQSIYIPKGIAVIEKQAFYNYPALSVVTIEGGVVPLTIGENAFGLLSQLTEINIPDRVTQIGTRAFCDCVNLQTVNIGEDSTLLEIGGYAFQNTAITSFFLPDTVEAIREYAFDCCTRLTELLIGEDSALLSIGEYAFSRSSLVRSTSEGTAFIVPKGVISLGGSAFRNCVSLVELRFAPDSDLNTIGSHVFARTRITDLVIPDNADLEFASSVFSGCAYLESITLPFIGPTRTLPDENDENAIKKHVFSAFFDGEIPSSLRKVTITNAQGLVEGAFKNCSGLTEVTIPSTVAILKEGVFEGCDSQLRILCEIAENSIPIGWEDDLSGWASVEWGVGSQDSTDGKYTFVEHNGFAYLTSYKGSGGEIVIPTEIDGYVVVLDSIGIFDGNTTITKITIPDGMTEISTNAFYNCTALTQIVIESDLQRIGKNAFTGSGLTSFVLPRGVEVIEEGVFENCEALESITLETGTELTAIKNNAFKNSGIQSFAFIAQLTEIGLGAFEGCTDLSTITFADGIVIETLNMSNFKGTNISEIIIPASVKSIGESCFSDCSLLETITFEVDSELLSIGDYAFMGTALSSITLPEKVVEIGSYAFSEVTTLVGTFTLPPTVTTLGERALYGCSGITDVYFSTSLNDIGAYAFGGVDATLHFAENGSLESIASNAFSEYAGTSLTIPDYVTEIENGALYLADDLQTLSLPFVGTDGEAGNEYTDVFGYIFGYSPNDITGTQQYYSPTAYAYYYIPSALKTVTITGDFTALNSGAFSGCSSIESISFKRGETATTGNSIGQIAFNGASNLTSVTLPDGIVTLGKGAFEDCTSLTEITLKSGLTTIGENAFKGATALLSIALPSTVEKIDSGAFNGCTSLGSVTIPTDSVLTGLGDGAFMSTAITEFSFPKGVLSIPTSLFEDAGSLASVSFDENSTLNAIGDRAFYNSALKSFNVLPTVETIGNQAFANCAELGKAVEGESRAFTIEKIGSVLKTIGIGALMNTPIRQIELPKGLESLGALASVNDPIGMIRYGVFEACIELETVTFEDESMLSVIEDRTFMGSKIGTINLPTNLTKIGDEGFSGCSSLQTVSFTGSLLTEIGFGAFRASGLTSIILPDSLTTIGANCFEGCVSLAEMTLPFIGKERENENAVDGLFGHVFGKTAGTNLVETTQYYNAENSAVSYIPELLKKVTVTSATLLDFGAFSDCKHLENILINDTVEEIRSSAFNGCAALTSITLPFVGKGQIEADGWEDFISNYISTATDMFGFVFGSRTSNGSTAIWQFKSASDATGESFSIPSGLKSVTISSPDYIAYGAFSNCNMIENITIGESLVAIGASAFFGASELAKMTLPFVGASREASNDQGLFGYIFGTTAFSESVGINQYYSVESSINTRFPKGLNEVIITDATAVSYGALDGLYMLTTLLIDGTYTEISDKAFRFVSVSEFRIISTVTNIGDLVFDSCSSLVTVVIDSAEIAAAASDKETNGKLLWSANTIYILDSVETYGSYISSYFEVVTADREGYVKLQKK